MSLITLSPAFTLKLPFSHRRPAGHRGPVTMGPPRRMLVPIITAGGKLFLQDGTAAATLGEGWDFGILGTDEFLKINFRTYAKTVNTNETLYIQIRAIWRSLRRYAASSSTFHGPSRLGSVRESRSSSMATVCLWRRSLTSVSDTIFQITLNVETSAAEFEWMNRTVFVGRGRFDVEAHIRFVVFEVFKATA